jgi:hypothetical protein
MILVSSGFKISIFFVGSDGIVQLAAGRPGDDLSILGWIMVPSEGIRLSLSLFLAVGFSAPL